MDFQFIRDRISVLRTKKNVSEYRMSTDLGHSKSYMQSISSGRAMPSLGEFLYICEYLDDGYTANMKRILYKNPNGYFAYINNRLKIDKSVKHKFLDSVRYMAMAIAHKKKGKIKGAVYPLYALAAYLPGWMLYRRDFKRYRDE